MSTFNEIDIVCSECREEFKGTVWTAVHATEDPVLNDILLGGELNLLMCPKCSHVAYQEHFILYQHPKQELIAYIYPPDQKSEEDFLRKTMLINFAEAQKVYMPKERKDYEPILLFGLENFLVLMREEEALEQQSQVAEAICKNHDLPFVVLRPSEARRLGIMRVLPIQKGPGRLSILEGLKNLLHMNPALDRYAALQSSIEKNSSWVLNLKNAET